MATKTFVKLGEKAQSFSCPSSGIKVLPGQVVELSAKDLQSKKLKAAIKGNHLEKVSEEEYQKFVGKTNVNNEEEVDDSTTLSGEDLAKLKKPELLKLATEALEATEEETDETPESLEAMTKAELVEFITSLQD